MISKCRLCRSKKLKYALRLKQWVYVICENCTLLQRQENIPYEIDFNFEGRVFELNYYPRFLKSNQLDCVTENSCMFFSLTAIETLLLLSGYKITDAQIIGSKLMVQFDILNRVEKIQVNEKSMRLDNQFTYFMWAVKLKK